MKRREKTNEDLMTYTQQKRTVTRYPDTEQDKATKKVRFTSPLDQYPTFSEPEPKTLHHSSPLDKTPMRTSNVDIIAGRSSERGPIPKLHIPLDILMQLQSNSKSYKSPSSLLPRLPNPDLTAQNPTDKLPDLIYIGSSQTDNSRLLEGFSPAIPKVTTVPTTIFPAETKDESLTKCGKTFFYEYIHPTASASNKEADSVLLNPRKKSDFTFLYPIKPSDLVLPQTVRPQLENISLTTKEKIRSFAQRELEKTDAYDRQTDNFFTNRELSKTINSPYSTAK